MLIHVCSLSALPDVAARVRPHRVLSLVKLDTAPDRPEGVEARDHLHLDFNDITEERDGLVAPSRAHVDAILDFAGGWDRERALLVHCWAGISRSTAAAVVVAAALRPDLPEDEIADRLRAASPTATPNIRLVGFADQALGREGRLTRAIRRIGRGADTHEGTPFVLDIGR